MHVISLVRPEPISRSEPGQCACVVSIMLLTARLSVLLLPRVPQRCRLQSTINMPSTSDGIESFGYGSCVKRAQPLAKASMHLISLRRRKVLAVDQA
jgi:hypothetical protein